MTMNFFDGLVFALTKNRKENAGLREWARLEYKSDAEYAYNYYQTYGSAPVMGVKV